VSTVMNLLVPYNIWKLFSTLATGRFPRRTQLREVSLLNPTVEISFNFIYNYYKHVECTSFRIAWAFLKMVA
jgi:hypothetical protein